MYKLTAAQLVWLAAALACGGGDDGGGTATQSPTPASSPSSAGPSASGAATEALILYRDAMGDLIALDLETGEQHRQPVDFSQEVMVQAACAPDGSRIAYLKQNFERIEREVLIRGEDAPAESIALPSAVQTIAWSPDATQLAFTEWDGIAQQAKMSVLDIAGGEATELITASDYMGAPSWSPDGSRVAYYLQDPGGEFSEIWVLEIASGEARKVSPEDGFLWLDPAWSPDGSFLLASAAVTNNIQVYKLDPDTGEATQFTQATDIYRRGPQFSPDGSTVAYTGSIIAPGISARPVLLHSFGIFLIDADGSRERALTPDPRIDPSADPILDAFFQGWCLPGPWLDDLWSGGLQ